MMKNNLEYFNLATEHKEELLDENKIPCLFYDNEKAGCIYNKLGFRQLGNWSIYYKIKR